MRRAAVLICAVLLTACGSGGQPSSAYQACERAARAHGLDPYSPDGLAAIGHCMDVITSTTKS